MRQHIALEIVKREQKKAVIDAFIKELRTEDATFKEELRQYMYPYLTRAFLNNKYTKPSKYYETHDIEDSEHYRVIRLNLASCMTGIPVSKLSDSQRMPLMPLITTTIHEFEAFRAAFEKYKNHSHNNKELWLQYIRFDIMCQFFIDIVVHKEHHHSVNIQEYDHTYNTLESLTAEQGVSIDALSKKAYNLTVLSTANENIGGCFVFVDDMIKQLDIVLAFIKDAREHNTLNSFRSCLDYLNFDVIRRQDVMERMANGYYHYDIKDIDEKTRLDSQTEYDVAKILEINDKIRAYDHLMQEIRAFTDSLPTKDDEYRELLRRFLVMTENRIRKADGTVHGESYGFNETAADFADMYHKYFPLSYTPLERAKQLLTTLENDSDIFIKLFDQLNDTYSVTDGTMWMLFMPCNFIHIALCNTLEYVSDFCSLDEYSDVRATINDTIRDCAYFEDKSLLETQEECYQYIIDTFEYRSRIYPFLKDALEKNDPKFIHLASDYLALSGIYLTDAAKKLMIPLYKHDNRVKEGHDLVERHMEEYRRMKECKVTPEQIKTATEIFNQDMKDVEEYVAKLHIEDDTYRDAVCKYIKASYPIPCNMEGAIELSNKRDQEYDSVLATLISYVIQTSLTGTDMEQAIQLHEIVKREFETFKDTFNCYKAGTASGTDLYLQHMRYDVVADKLDDIMMRNSDYETFKTPETDAINIKAQKFDLKTKQGCIDNIELNISYLEKLNPVIHKALANADAALLHAASSFFGLIVLNTHYPVDNIRTMFRN